MVVCSIRDGDLLWGLSVNLMYLMYWMAVFFLPVLTPRVTHVGTMAFSTVMGSYKEGPLSHSHTVCIRLCVFEKLSLVLSHFIHSFWCTLKNVLSI